jgi:hypothetical protein
MTIPRILRARAARYMRMRDGFEDELTRSALLESAEALEREAEAIERYARTDDVGQTASWRKGWEFSRT